MADKVEKSELTGLSKNKYPTYVLYRYLTNRSKDTSCSSGEDNKTKTETASAGDHVSTVTKKDQHMDYSLTVVISGLNAENEELFSKFITRRFAKGAVQGAGGHISGLELGSSGPLLCYYSLLEGDSSKESSPLPSNTPDDAPLGSVDSAYLSNEFLVCLIAPADAVLDLFRPELDKYSTKLHSLLDADLSEVATKIQPYLEDWFAETTQYLCRCIKLLNEDVKYLINAALLDAQIEVQCSNEKTSSDLKRFVECCSLSELIQATEPFSLPSADGDKADHLLADISVSDPAGKQEVLNKQKSVFKLIVDGDTCTFHNHDSSKFCADWGTALSSGDVDNPVHLRQIIDNYKLRAIQDMNNLKRLLRQAESDYYSLFKCYVFLKSCGNAPILLQHAQSELNALDNRDTPNVLNVLQEFITEVKVTS